MPAQYEAIKRALMRVGVPEKEAEERAAKIYNSVKKDKEEKIEPEKESKKKK
jgi:hypothetical protein